MTQTLTQERRRHQRIRTLMKGVISYSRGTMTIPCIVRDISSFGARARIQADVVVPAHFDLILPERNESFHCRLVRKSGDDVGMEFILPQAESVPERAPVSVASPAIQPQVAPVHDDSALREEILLLKAKIVDLEADNKRMKTMLTRLGIE